MELSELSALSPLDGRYRKKIAALAPHFSEFGLIRYRLKIEIEWFKALAQSQLPRRPRLSVASIEQLDRIARDFSEQNARKVKEIEARTNHDVKALEYWLKETCADNAEIHTSAEFIHFACTSEDINNLAYACALKDARESVMLPAADAVIAELRSLAHAHADAAMLARTHGQAATPTTLGKEMANVAYRLKRARQKLADVSLTGKINGAVGNYNAHLAAYPEFDWESFAKRFVESLGLEFNAYTIQIEPHDSLAECFDAFARMNSIVLDLDRDIWGYISLGYFRQKVKAGEVGSSTMPHKVNPIDFENSEGNAGIANALLRHLSEKLPVSRWQRDLSDSTALRGIGSALGHSLLALDSCLKGLRKLEVNAERMREDLAQSWEVLAEAIQTVMRWHGLPDPYEQLKELTRGRGGIARDALHAFIGKLAIPEPDKRRLLELTPATYTGLAPALAKRI
jgi:adenylosuccinate lyase